MSRPWPSRFTCRGQRWGLHIILYPHPGDANTEGSKPSLPYFSQDSGIWGPRKHYVIKTLARRSDVNSIKDLPRSGPTRRHFPWSPPCESHPLHWSSPEKLNYRASHTESQGQLPPLSHLPPLESQSEATPSSRLNKCLGINEQTASGSTTPSPTHFLPHFPLSTLTGPDLQAHGGHVPPQITWRILASLTSLSIVNMVARVMPI